MANVEIEKVPSSEDRSLPVFAEFDDLRQDVDHVTSGCAHDHSAEQRVLSAGQVAEKSDLEPEQAREVPHQVELTLVGLVHAGEEPEQCALSRSVRAYDSQRFAMVYVEADLSKRPVRSGLAR